jgi:hypothetical protein
MDAIHVSCSALRRSDSPCNVFSASISLPARSEMYERFEALNRQLRLPQRRPGSEESIAPPAALLGALKDSFTRRTHKLEDYVPRERDRPGGQPKPVPHTAWLGARTRSAACAAKSCVRLRPVFVVHGFAALCRETGCGCASRARHEAEHLHLPLG